MYPVLVNPKCTYKHNIMIIKYLNFINIINIFTEGDRQGLTEGAYLGPCPEVARRENMLLIFLKT